MWIWLAVMVPAVVPLLLRHRPLRPASAVDAVGVGVALVAAGTVVAVAWAAGVGAPDAPAGPVWLAAGDMALRAGLRVDALSGLLALAAVASAVVALGAGAGAGSGKREASRRVDLVAWLLAAQLLVLLADSLWLLLVGWEAMGIVAARMMDAGEGPGARQAGRGRAALLTSRTGGLALLLAAALLLRETGTLTLVDLPRLRSAGGADAAGLAVAALVLLAVACRAGIVPLHGWLVRAGGVPGPVGALHAGVVWTSAVYLLARLIPVLGGGAAMLALGAGLAVVSALSLFVAAVLVPRARMPAFLGPAHAALAVAAVCCGGGLGAVLWTAAVGPLLVSVALLSATDPRASHGAAILSALAAVLWIGLPGLGPLVALRSRALASLALPPVGGAGLAVGAALAVAVAAVAAVVWLGGGRCASRLSRGVLVPAGLPLAALFGVGIASWFGAGPLAGLIGALQPLVIPDEGRFRLAGGADPWLLLPGLAALAGALIAVAVRLVAAPWIHRVAVSRTGRDLRLAASRGWHLHRALRAIFLPPVLLLTAALAAPATDAGRFADVEGDQRTRDGGHATIIAARLAAPLAALLAAAALWLTLGPVPVPGLALAAFDGLPAAAVLLVTALALWCSGAAPRDAASTGIAGGLLAAGILLPVPAGWLAWALAGAVLVLIAARDRALVAVSLLGGVALLALAVLGGPLASPTVATRATAPGWRLVLLIGGAVLMLGTAPLRGLRSRALAALPAPAVVLVAAAWPIVGLHALSRRGSWLDPGGWAAVVAWLVPVGAAIVLLAGPSALGRRGAAGVAVDLHSAAIGWALVGLGIWTRPALAGAMLLITVQAVWLAAHLLTLRARVPSAGWRGAGPAPLILAGALVAGSGAFPAMLLILAEGQRGGSQGILVAVFGTLLLALPVREAWSRASLSQGRDGQAMPPPSPLAPGSYRVPLLLATLLAVAPAVWPAPLAGALYRDADRILLPPVPFRPADPEIAPSPERVAGRGGRADPPPARPPSVEAAPVISQAGGAGRTAGWRDARRDGA